MLGLQYKPQSKAVKWCHHRHCQHAFIYSFSSRVKASAFYPEGCDIHLEPTPPRVETILYYLCWTNPDCTGKRSGEKAEVLEYFQCIDNMILQGNTAGIFEKGEKTIQILLKAGFATQQSQGTYPENAVFRSKWHYRFQWTWSMEQQLCPHQPATRKHRFSKVLWVFEGCISDYSQIVKPLYHVITKNDFKQGPNNNEILNKLNRRLLMQ